MQGFSDPERDIFDFDLVAVNYIYEVFTLRSKCLTPHILKVSKFYSSTFKMQISRVC